MERIKIGILRETKTPPDRRVAIPPSSAAMLPHLFPGTEVIVQPSSIRCFSDDEYRTAGVTVQEDISGCDWLIGVKEVKLEALLPGKRYLFFAHVAKMQAYNRPLLLEALNKRITLVDYEYLRDEYNVRLIAFGRWAGIVGAFNGLRGWGLKSGRFNLDPAHSCHDRREMDAQLTSLDTGPVRILVTGGGRVATGVLETLFRTAIPVVGPDEYLANPALTPVICRIDPWHYTVRKDGNPFSFDDFCHHPEQYKSDFRRFIPSTDLLMSAHFWDPASPKMWDPADTASDDFRIRVIADITCDIRGSVPTTIRATSIADPFYDLDRRTGSELPAFSDPEAVTVMSIDNLPGELPRDASEEFGSVLLRIVLPCMLGNDPGKVVHRATITRNGELNDPFLYLDPFVRGE
jgi:hypothetical protein